MELYRFSPQVKSAGLQYNKAPLSLSSLCYYKYIVSNERFSGRQPRQDVKVSDVSGNPSPSSGCTVGLIEPKLMTVTYTAQGRIPSQQFWCYQTTGLT